MKDQPKPKMNITIQNLNTKNIWGVEKKNSWNLVAFLVMFSYDWPCFFVGIHHQILRSGDSDGKCKRIESENLLQSNLY